MFRRVALLALALASSAPGQASDGVPLFGVWGVSEADCKADEGPYYKTLILGRKFEQYENHCRISGATLKGNNVKLSMSCESEGQTYQETVTVTLASNGILLQGSESKQGLVMIACKHVGYSFPYEGERGVTTIRGTLRAGSLDASLGGVNFKARSDVGELILAVCKAGDACEAKVKLEKGALSKVYEVRVMDD